MDIENIKYNQELMHKKMRLEHDLETVNEFIGEQQASCSHIRVCLGWNGPFQYRDTSFHQCLLCYEFDPESKYKIVDATYYKRIKYSHGETSRYREERLLDLEKLVIKLLTENPNLTEEELVTSLNETIQQEEEMTTNLEKKIGHI